MAQSKAAAPLLALLLSMTASAGSVPRGRVLGPANSQTSRLLHRTNLLVAARAMAAGSTCAIYFDATGQLNFTPPPPNTPITPALGPANITAGGVTAFAHGSQALTAAASGNALSAAAGVIAPHAVLPSVTVNTIQGIAYFATGTNCTQASFTTTLQSNPAGSAGPNGTVLAQMGASTIIAANYTPSYADQGEYICSEGRNSFYCEVWRVDVTFAFLTNSFPGNGAGTYTLTINQVTLSSP
ncbi:MAG: hypothetical protein ACREPY_16085 [Rhodanobacteraceae bacterium]